MLSAMSKVMLTHLLLLALAGVMAESFNVNDDQNYGSPVDAFVEILPYNTSILLHKKESGYTGIAKDDNTPTSNHPFSNRYIYSNETEIWEKVAFPQQDSGMTGTSIFTMRSPDLPGRFKSIYSNIIDDVMLISLSTIVLLH